MRQHWGKYEEAVLPVVGKKDSAAEPLPPGALVVPGHRPRGSLAHTPHSSHRADSPADSPRVYFAAMAQLDHRASCMTAESGGLALASPSRWPWLETALFTASGWKLPHL